MLRAGRSSGNMPQTLSQREHHCQGQYLFGALFFVAGLLYLAKSNRSLALGHAGQRRARPTHPVQPRAHVAGNGIDCRYCHTTVKTGSIRGHPADEDLHELPFADFCHAPRSRAGARELPRDKPIAWTRVHDLPDFAYFDHSIHIAKGVGCSTCHGPVDKMPLMRKAELAADGMVPRLPQASGSGNVRPRDEVFNMNYMAPPFSSSSDSRLVAENRIRKMTDCNACHRCSPSTLLRASPARCRILANARRTTRRQPRRARRRRVRVAAARSVRRGRAAGVSEIDGGVARARGHGGLHAQPPEQIVPYVRQPDSVGPGAAARSTRPRCRSAAARRACSSKATRDVRQNRRQSRCTLRASAPPTSTRRRRCSICTIPTACERSRTSEKSSVVCVHRGDAHRRDAAAGDARAPGSGSSRKRSARQRWPAN